MQGFLSNFRPAEDSKYQIVLKKKEEEKIDCILKKLFIVLGMVVQDQQTKH